MSADQQLELSGTGLPIPAPAHGVTGRAVALGLVSIVAVILLIHWAELILGSSRGHSAMANTSIPLGAFASLMLLVSLNSLVGRCRRRWRPAARAARWC